MGLPPAFYFCSNSTFLYIILWLHYSHFLLENIFTTSKPGLFLITLTKDRKTKKKKKKETFTLSHIHSLIHTLPPTQKCILVLTLKEPGFLDPSHSRGGGGFRPPLRSRKPIDETSSVWY